MRTGAQAFTDFAVAEEEQRQDEVSLFPGAVLGSDPQNLSRHHSGTLDFTSMATGLVASIDGSRS